MRNGMYAYVGILLAIAIAFALSGLTGCTKSVAASTPQPPAGWTCDDEAGTCTRTAPATPADEFDDESGEGEEMPAVTAEQIHALAGSQRRVVELPAIEITGCVPVNEPGAVTFCESEVGPIVGPDALTLE